MTTQQLFETSLQDQSDLFQVMKQSYRDKMKEAPLQELAMAISENPKDLQGPQMIMTQWIYDEMLPMIEHDLHLSQEQALKTIGSWVGVMGK